MEHACRGLLRTTAFSMMMQYRPTRMEPPLSPIMRAPCNTREPAPIATSPQIVASGAIHAVGSICGRFPACSTSILSTHCHSERSEESLDSFLGGGRESAMFRFAQHERMQPFNALLASLPTIFPHCIHRFIDYLRRDVERRAKPDRILTRAKRQNAEIEKTFPKLLAGFCVWKIEGEK